MYNFELYPSMQQCILKYSSGKNQKGKYVIANFYRPNWQVSKVSVSYQTLNLQRITSISQPKSTTSAPALSKKYMAMKVLYKKVSHI